METTPSNNEVKLTFHILQNGKPAVKEVTMTRDNVLKYNALPKTKWADMYEAIVRDKAYIRIADLTNSN